MNAAGEININKDDLKEINRASIVEEETDNNKNSSPVHDDTGDEQKKSE